MYQEAVDSTDPTRVVCFLDLPQKYIALDATKPIQLSVKQDGTVDLFEMQASWNRLWNLSTYECLKCTIVWHLSPGPDETSTVDDPFQVHLAGDSPQPQDQRTRAVKP